MARPTSRARARAGLAATDVRTNAGSRRQFRGSTRPVLVFGKVIVVQPRKYLRYEPEKMKIIAI